MMARFCAKYPGLWKVPGGWDHTHDGVIPWQTFWLLYAQLRAVASVQQLDDASAVTAGIEMAFGGDGAARRVKDAIEDEGLAD